MVQLQGIWESVALFFVTCVILVSAHKLTLIGWMIMTDWKKDRTNAVSQAELLSPPHSKLYSRVKNPPRDTVRNTRIQAMYTTHHGQGCAFFRFFPFFSSAMRFRISDSMMTDLVMWLKSFQLSQSLVDVSILFPRVLGVFLFKTHL